MTEGQTVEGDVWNWQPDWKGNSWLMAAGDYGSMTFSLKGNAVITVDHKMLGRQESGTFFLDAAAKSSLLQMHHRFMIQIGTDMWSTGAISS